MNKATAGIQESWWKDKNLLSIIQWNKTSKNDEKNAESNYMHPRFTSNSPAT